MAAIRLEHITKRFGTLTALSDVAFDVAEGEFFTIIGPTKAGKTTILRTIAGLERPETGEVFLDDRPVTALHPSKRNLSLLFQNVALFPHYTGFENIAFPLRVAGLPDVDVQRRVRETAGMLRIGHLLDRLPRTFSGGEQQRVAIGRAIIGASEATLLDEPLSNLDARIRLALRNELKRLHRDLGRTFVYVTHDQVEAMTLSDRVLVLNRGTIQQIGTPEEIYDRPRNRFVAQFIGSPPMSLIPGEIVTDGGTVVFTNEAVRQDLTALGDRLPGRLRAACLGVRPEDVELSTVAMDGGFQAEVSSTEPLGPKTVVDVKLGGWQLSAFAGPDWRSEAESVVWVRFQPSRLHILDEASDRFLTSLAEPAATR